MLNEIWLTENQFKFLDGFRLALKENRIISFVDHPGTGFKYALRRFMMLQSDVRLVFLKIPLGSKNSKEISIDMMTQLMTIRFNNFKYIQPSAFDLIRVLGDRVRQDLRGKRILIVCEGVDNLTKSKLADFMRLIHLIKFPCGIVLRFGPEYYEKVRAKNERLFNDFWAFTQWRKVSTPNTPDDIEKFCRYHGLIHPQYLKQIREQTSSFTIALQYIKKYNSYQAPSQLNLFTENLVRF